MNLIDNYLPEYTFSERHAILIEASQKACYEKMYHLDLSQIWPVKTLFKLRGLPTNTQSLHEFAQKMNFTLLQEKPYSEFLFGFTVNHKGVHPITDREKFIHEAGDWRQKIIWSFVFVPKEEKTLVVTITRIKCLTIWAKIRFSFYWLFVRPFSGLIRRLSLKRLKKELETSL